MSRELSFVAWTGNSGTIYEFQNHPIGVDYKSRAGVYIFCRRSGLTRWKPIYIGMTASFHQRLTQCLDSHHQIDDIRAAGATHLCTLHIPGSVAARLRVETDLRHYYDTPCNDQ